MSEETSVMIGLETHIQLDTNSKLFCGCQNELGSEPNTNVCETCLGHPGSKPRLNKKVLEHAVKTAQALGCGINEEFFFSRKTYFYPDMSKNYQITQYEIPVGEEGELKIKTGDEEKNIGITRLHIEEDPAKLDHVGGNIGDSDYSLVDYNRAGTPLLEIVTDPDFTSPEEARAYLQELIRIFEYLGIYDPESNYSVKSDANVSINGGERVEVKNITGTADIEKALSYEISRQKQLERRNKEVTQETRNFNPDMGVTQSMRLKETEMDYGYIFDPDLTSQEFTQEQLDNFREQIPELPHEKFQRFLDKYSVSSKIVESLTREKQMADDFEQLAEERDPEILASFMTGDLRKVLNYNEISYTESSVKKEWIDYIVALLEDDKITDRNAEMVTRQVVENEIDPEEIVEKEDLLKAEDDEVDSIVAEVVEKNPDAVEDYRTGEEGAINFLVGQVMQQSQGKADPKTAREKIMNQLNE